jgi:hypothetical protein
VILLPVKAMKAAANTAIAISCVGAGAALVIALYTAPMWTRGRDKDV